jgi:hypothetical protein
MSQPGQPRPMPGPPPVPGPLPAGPRTDPAEVFAELAARPIAEHVAVFEAEHDRLQRELSTIDQL